MEFRKSFAVLLALVLLFNSALSVSNAWMSVALAEEETAEEQVLVFKTFGYRDGYSDYAVAEAFNKTHPGKKVIVEEALTGDALATELMSGEADYILNVFNTNLDASKCAASGIFVDLYEWMDADPDFRREDYYQNVYEATEYDGHLYGILGHFYLPVIFLNKTIAEAVGASYEPLDSINIAEILDLYDIAKAQGLIAENTPLVFGDAISKSSLIMELEFSGFVDIDEKTSHFSDSAFVELLKRTNEIYSSRRSRDGSSISIDPTNSTFGRAILEQKTSSLFVHSLMTMEPVEGGTLAEPHEGLMGPLVWEAANGNACAFGGRLIMVPKSCSNPELAWEFIKFCIAPLDKENGENPETAYYKSGETKNFPVSRVNLASYAEYYQIFGNASFDTYLAKLEERIAEINEFYLYTMNARNVVAPILEQYFDYGTITAEECARQMDDRLFLYLNE